MKFVHDDPDFDALLRIVADKRGIALALVEKDYWVTHVLWSLQDRGFEVWFKGGTSLSKGFGLIERFSEDLDLKLEAGRVEGVPPADDWKRDSTSAITARRAHLEALSRALSLPGMVTAVDDGTTDERWRSINVRATYPAKHLGPMRGVLKPFVLLELGSARVTPSLPRDMSSFVHEELVAQGQLTSWTDNRPRALRCVHPLVTLLEKLDALVRRAPDPDRDAATFVRHYEDAARIVRGVSALPPLDGYAGVSALADDMVRHKQIKSLPDADHTALTLAEADRAGAIRRAYEAIAPMYWAPRLTLEECVETLRTWLTSFRARS